MHVGVIGAGWAGLACAIRATQLGHQVTVLEASNHVGGRARSVLMPGFAGAGLDNGQHILIGAYTQTLALMRLVGVSLETSLLRRPMALKFPDGSGLQLPDWPPPLDLVGGVLSADSWTSRDRLSLLKFGGWWFLQNFKCEDHLTVDEICQGLTKRVRDVLIEPLCISALNIPSARASAAIFLRVLQDALLVGRGSSNYLLPRQDLSSLFPQPASQWLAKSGQQVLTSSRVERFSPLGDLSFGTWKVAGMVFDQLVIATDSVNAARILETSAMEAKGHLAGRVKAWASLAGTIAFEGIGTVYVQCTPDVRLPHPILALKYGSDSGPAQFVLDRGQLTGHQGLLAFVISACSLSKEDAESQVLQQARAQLGLSHLAAQTIIEKRATFACTPALKRPPMRIAPGLWACGDYVDGPYPATLEGAVRSGMAVAESLQH